MIKNNGEMTSESDRVLIVRNKLRIKLRETAQRIQMRVHQTLMRYGEELPRSNPDHPRFPAD